MKSWIQNKKIVETFSMIVNTKRYEINSYLWYIMFMMT